MISVAVIQLPCSFHRTLPKGTVDSISLTINKHIIQFDYIYRHIGIDLLYNRAKQWLHTFISLSSLWMAQLHCRYCSTETLEPILYYCSCATVLLWHQNAPHCCTTATITVYDFHYRYCYKKSHLQPISTLQVHIPSLTVSSFDCVLLKSYSTRHLQMTFCDAGSLLADDVALSG